MRKRHMKKIYLGIISIYFLSCINLNAQGHRHGHEYARHNNFYHKVELNYGNLYSFAISSCLTGVLNYFIDDAIFETGLGVPIYRQQTSDLFSFSRNNLFGIQPNDLIHNFDGGIKLGYQTYDPRFVNFGVCALASYKYEPFSGTLLQNDNIQSLFSIRRILLGGNLMLCLGEMGMNTQVILEVGLRYSKGLTYNAPSLLYGKGALNDGLVSHYGISIGGPGYFQNIKLFADITHYNLITSPDLTLSPIYVGLSWTVTPQQSISKQ